MNPTTNTDSRSPPHAGGVITRAGIGLEDHTAQPCITSGFGAVIERERALQTATEASLGGGTGNHRAEVDRILRHQHAKLRATIALLEQRYESLPQPGRFLALHNLEPAACQLTGSDEGDILTALIAQHHSLMADIDKLIALGPDGQRGELILAEVRRNHEEMAWMLTALLHEEDTAGRTTTPPAVRGSPAGQDRWDNEGGSPRSAASST